MRVASSPITGLGYVSACWDAPPWSEELATVEAELAKMPVKLGKEANPTNSETQH